MKHTYLALTILCAFTLGCNTVVNNTNTPDEDTSTDDSEEGTPAGDTETDLNHPTGNTAVVLGTDFTVGSLDLISLSDRTDTQDVTTAHSDGAVFSFDNKLYVTNRLGADNIQVIDPANDFQTTLQCSTGQGTNPQSIIVLSPTKAYVTLYQPDDNSSADLTVDDVLIVNPSAAADCSDFITGTIDLTPYTAEDDTRLPRASAMVIVDDTIFVAIQDLPASFAAPDQPGKIIAIDTETDTVSGSVTLSGKNPVGLDYSSVSNLLYVSEADFFDITSTNAGIEVVDPEDLTTRGIVIDDVDLQGSLGAVETNGTKGYIVSGSFNLDTGESITKVFSFNLDPDADHAITQLYSSNAYIADIAIDENGKLLVADWSTDVNGVAFVDTSTGAADGSPITTGASPSSITFVER